MQRKAISKTETEPLEPRPLAQTISYRKLAYRALHDGGRPSKALTLGDARAFDVCRRRRLRASAFISRTQRGCGQRVRAGGCTHLLRNNFPQTPVNTSDIRQISETRATVEAFLASFAMAPGDDVVSGSPPCSEFSTLGGGMADPGVTKSYSDTTQSEIASLIFDFMRFNRAALPKAIISENVPPLAGAYRPLLEAALDHLRSASEGGQRLPARSPTVCCPLTTTRVAQSRRRVLIVAVRSDVAQVVGLQSDADIFRLLPSPISAPVSIREAFKGLYQTAEHVRPWREAMLSSSSARHGFSASTPTRALP